MDPARFTDEATRLWIGRTLDVQPGRPVDPVGIRARDRRLEIRTTAEDRQLIDRAVAAQQVLADRAEFRLDPEALETWERINQRPAQSLKGLRALMDRPSPFQE